MPKANKKPDPGCELIGGPYVMPVCEKGQWIVCGRRGEVEVDGITDAPIPWPYVRTGAARAHRGLILCGDLVRAVKKESVQAVMWHWDVSDSQVATLRRLLKVERFNPGTLALWGRLIDVRMPIETRGQYDRGTEK